MYKIRDVKMVSGSVSVQVYKIVDRKRKVVKHIGTAHNDQGKNDLHSLANEYILQVSKQLALFENAQAQNILYLNQSEFLGIYYTFLYEVINGLLTQIGFSKIEKSMLLDLVIIRIVEPASKLRSIELLNSYFGIRHRRQTFYQSAPQWLDLKSKIEKIVIGFAKQNYAFNFDLLFYDVTTLYFETFEEDELRKNGFSKDNKSQQPQILVALLVTKEGFPIAYEIFTGNTFEGHTIIPVVKAFIKEHAVKEFTVVADAAMISATNIQELLQSKINYIVGARLGNLSNELIRQIDQQIMREDGKSIRIKTDNGYLICSFSSVRYRKDNYEMQKQIEKAKQIIETPSKSKKLKFTKTAGGQIELNEKLVEKTKKLLGIKGYYTNLEEQIIDNQTVIERYHELYKIEQAFRISKNDLQTRPIFHFKEEPIKLHMLICFMALVISKHIELTTGDSIRKFITECKKITDARMLNKITHKELRIRTKYSQKVDEYISKFKVLT